MKNNLEEEYLVTAAAENGREHEENREMSKLQPKASWRKWPFLFVGCSVVGIILGTSQIGAAAPSPLAAPPKPTITTDVKSLNNLTLLADVKCPKTCHKQDCDFWREKGHSCHDLEALYGCNCGGCMDCECPPTCNGNTCNYWKKEGYSCSRVEMKWGCDCTGCSCSTKYQSPSPLPTPRPAPSSGCDAIKATSYYPLPSDVYTKGIPPPLLATPNTMTMCDVQKLQDDCVAKINHYRKAGLKSSLNKAPVSFSKCMNERAVSDLYYAEHKGKGCDKFTMSLDCGLKISGRRGENSCCLQKCTSYDSCKSALFSCFKGFWDEHKLLIDSGNFTWTKKTHNYWNVVGDYRTVGCGFGFDSHGNMLAKQTFY